MVMQRPAKPCTPVRFRPQPPFIRFTPSQATPKPARFKHLRVFLLCHTVPYDTVKTQSIYGTFDGILKNTAKRYRQNQIFDRRHMLSDFKISKAKPQEKPYKLTDGKGFICSLNRKTASFDGLTIALTASAKPWHLAAILM